HVRAALVIDLEWEVDSLGRPIKFKEVEGSERELPCELVTLAMGFLHPQHEGLLQQIGVECDERGNVKAREGEYKASADKYFAAGDMRRGQSLVVWAISEGRECARKVDEYLMGATELESKEAVCDYA
ncbi:MAG TPA: glutamate synthase, partial [Sphingobacterium sp.]|nr:glutamate synthase [Sphingobacterium sp.]